MAKMLVSKTGAPLTLILAYLCSVAKYLHDNTLPEYPAFVNVVSL
jgi:hypothetical protein